MALNYGEDYYPKGSILDYGEDYYPSSKVEDPNSNVTKQTTIEENSDGTKTTTTIENKTNNPKWRGENQDKVDNSPIPGNETLKGNYYDDEVALKGDSTIFDQAEFGIEPSFGDNVVIMKHPSGTTIKAYSPEEVAMYTKNGYVAPNTEMVYPEVGTGSDKEKAEFNDWIDEYNARPEMTPSQFFDNPGIDTDAMGNPIQDANFAGMTVNDGADQYADLLNIQEGIDPNDDYYEGYILGNDTLEGNYYGDEVALKGDSDIFDQENFGDVEWGGKDTTPITMYHPSGFTQVVEGEEEAALFKRDGYFSTPEEALEDAKAEQAFKDAEQNSLNNVPSWLGQAEGPLTDTERDDLIAQDQSIIPNQTFDWQGIGKGPMTDAEREEANRAKDHEEVNKSEVGKEIVKEFQQRMEAGANPDAEVKKFLQSAAPLKEWRPKLFKAILGTLIGLAGGESLAAAGQAGFGAVGEDIAAEEKVAAEIAKEEREQANKVALEREKLGLKAAGNEAKALRESIEKGEDFAFKMVDKLRAVLPTDKKALYEDIDASKVIGGLGKLGTLYPSINWFQPQSQAVSQARMQGLSEWAAYVKKSVNSGNTAKTPPESFIEAQFVRNRYVGTFGKDGKKKVTIPRSYFGNDVEETVKTANVVNTEWAMARSTNRPPFNNAGFSQEAMWRLYANNYQTFLKTKEGKEFAKKYKNGGFEKWVQQNPRGYIIK